VHGAGEGASTYVAALLQSPHVELVGWAAESSPPQPGCPHLSEDQFEDAPLDAIVVCGAEPDRLSRMHLWLERRIHVLCERPLPADPAASRALYWTAHKEERTLITAAPYRYCADVMSLKAMLDSELLGELVDFEVHFASLRDLRQRDRAGSAVQGVLEEKGADAVDLARFLTGPVIEVFAVESRRVLGMTIDETARLTARTANATVHASLSWTLNKERDTYLEVYGSRGSVRLGWDQSYWRTGDRPWEAFGKGCNADQAIQGVVQDFVAAIRESAPARSQPEDTLANVEVIDAAYASTRNREWRKAEPGRHYLRVVRG
jgi:predicted dehydrogenase